MARARAFFEANGIGRITRLVTDNGSAYRSTAFNDAVRDFVGRHQRTRPYTPRHNGKVERYNRILAEEFPYARPSTSEEQRRDQLGQWPTHYNYHRPHTATAGNPPASSLPTPANNVTPSYS
ncbi:integrase core domain protein [Schaalia georgiae F0490]|uniref:Integrase core domain protein n=1 Tax=Schaalia georgiae F0490 TaxID=1125717 RepID=J0WIW4_9ACTO|nr:integrase core domain protein [Schaalia georgiae F0490]